MAYTPEDKAREEIERQLADAGWLVQDVASMNLAAGRGIAVREFSLSPGHGEADYLLYGDRKAIGVIEAKKEGDTLTGVEIQTEKYSGGLPAGLPAWHRPLPFLYQSTGIETRVTNCLDPDPRSRPLFSFHQPQTLIAWSRGVSGIASVQDAIRDEHKPYTPVSTLQRRLRGMPPIDILGMHDVQIKAIENLEKSLADNRPRALIQMTMGSGKTYTAVAQSYRLIKFASAKRILFLVDRGNLGKQAFKEFQQYTTPDDGRKFTELYNVQHLQSNKIDDASRVVITTIQRLYSILRGEAEFDAEKEELSAADAVPTLKNEPLPVVYNPAIPIETFDFVFTDECHRSIYNLWRQALEYFDAYLIGLTATPSKQTLGYFNRNLVMEYGHAQGVADGINVDFNVYRINTEITSKGGAIAAGFKVDRRDRRSRRIRWQELEEDLTYTPNQLDRAVVAPDQIRTIIRTFKEKLFTEIFTGRTHVPKTLIFAKDDSHADDIVRIVREEFGKGNNFCQKITYRTSTARMVDPDTGDVTFKSTGIKTDDLLSSFRNAYDPRIAVTVDMIATGTDVKPLEIVFFMRDVKSSNYFEQMKGRGTRTIGADDLKGVTPDANAKTHFVIIDAVGVCETERVDNPSLDRQPAVPLKKVLQVVGMGGSDEDVVSTLASRLARLDRQLSPLQRAEISKEAGQPLGDIIRSLVNSVDPTALEISVQADLNAVELTREQLDAAGATAREAALEPFHNNRLRDLILTTQQSNEQVIDTISADKVLFAGASDEAKRKALELTKSFREYLVEHEAEILALQFIYSRPYGKPPSLRQLKELAAELKRPPRNWTPEKLWKAYELVAKSKVHGKLQSAADLISLVKFALEKQTLLAPFAETVNERFARWLSSQESAGAQFTPDQRHWLEMIRDQIATSLTVETDDFELVPFSEEGGLGRAVALFGDRLPALLAELNEELVA